jgi:type II secretory pathway component PulF
MGIIDRTAQFLTDDRDHQHMFVIAFNHAVLIVVLLIPTFIIHTVLPHLATIGKEPDLWELVTFALLRAIELLPLVIVVLLLLNVLKVVLLRLFSRDGIPHAAAQAAPTLPAAPVAAPPAVPAQPPDAIGGGGE